MGREGGAERVNWPNLDGVIEQMRSAGLAVDHVEVGRLVRCPTDEDRGRETSGWYHIREWRGDSGDVLLVGSFGNWRHSGADGKPVVHQVSLRGIQLSDADRQAMRARHAEERKQAIQRRRDVAERAARHALSAWSRCATAGACEYLTRKGVGAHGVRFSPQGNLVVPAHDARGLVRGLQVIYGSAAAKAKRGRDKDFWPSGMSIHGLFCLLGGSPGRVVLVCEGYATGASLHEATGLPVAVAFFAGNLDPVGQALRKRYPLANLLFCGDDDYLGRCAACGQRTPVADAACAHCGQPHGKRNTGAAAAQAAAFTANGAWIVPAFPAGTDRRGTDFNDLHSIAGLPAVRAQIEDAIKAAGWAQASPEPAPADHPTGGDGGGGAADDLQFTFERMLADYALIYGTETVFDGRRRRIIGLGPLRAAAGKSLVRWWLEHADRRIVLPEQIGFDPSGTAGLKCNLWAGWPTVPRAGCCERQLELLEFLCSGDANPRDLMHWIVRWLAYPIQHPGAKMQTALLMHGPEGTGKNTFFGSIRQIYGRYGGIFSQVELESQYNGWASGKLFMIGNEVVTRAELYHQQGRLRNMVTEGEWQVNEKFLPSRLESNHCNFVFFSNRVDIAKLDAGDRRYCVVWTPPALDEAFYREVADEIADGGVAALHEYLRTVPLAGFTPHTKPPMTGAKAELIELGMDSTDRFWRDWHDGEVADLPYTACRTEDLYRAYRWHAQRHGVFRIAPANVLLATLGKIAGVQKKKAWLYDGQRRVQRKVFVPPGIVCPIGQDEISWLTEQCELFEAALSDAAAA